MTTHRIVFFEWIIEHQRVNADFLSNIILSDEAHFHPDYFVNRQNWCIWSSENPHVIIEQTNASTACHCSVWSLSSLEHTFF